MYHSIVMKMITI